MPPGFDPSEYGRTIAGLYDQLHADRSPDAAVDFIAGYADGGGVLEFGIGTGRIALPLAARGLVVEGIDGSAEMVAQLHSKPGGSDLRVEVGDFSITGTGRRYRVVVLAFDTINALPTQDAQVATFQNAAAHLEAGGVFIVENWVPDLAAFHLGRAVRLHDMSTEGVVVEVSEVHPAQQRLRTTRLAFGSDGVHLLPANHRYVWPAELDLMARLAGMALEDRWADWRRRPFTDDSRTYIAVYRRSA